jgi:uridine phosphorylase
VSHHYAPPARLALPSASLTETLRGGLERAGITYTAGTTWTIDAPYRETVEEVRHYVAEGVLTVEMEASALFAVGEYRGVEVASAFVVSDLLNRDRWHAQFHDAVEVLNRLYEATLDALTS